MYPHNDFTEKECAIEDSDDETEFNFLKIPILKDAPPNVTEVLSCDVGIQCELLNQEKRLIRMIKYCANLNPGMKIMGDNYIGNYCLYKLQTHKQLDVWCDYEELISTCKKMVRKHCTLGDFNISHDIGSKMNEEQNSLHPVDSNKLENIATTCNINECVPNTSSSRSDALKTNITSPKKRKSTERSSVRKSIRERRPPKKKYDERIFSTKRWKEDEESKKNDKENKKTPGSRKRSMSTNKVFSNSKKARNKMTSSKSFGGVSEESLKHEQKYLSFQHVRGRRLYSPTQWLEYLQSGAYALSCPTV